MDDSTVQQEVEDVEKESKNTKGNYDGVFYRDVDVPQDIMVSVPNSDSIRMEAAGSNIVPVMGTVDAYVEAERNEITYEAIILCAEEMTLDLGKGLSTSYADAVQNDLAVSESWYEEAFDIYDYVATTYGSSDY